MRSTSLLLFALWCALAASLAAAAGSKEYNLELHQTVIDHIDEPYDVEHQRSRKNSVETNLLGLIENDGRFSVLAKLVNDDDVLKDILSNTSASLTLFAPVDIAFRNVKKTPPKEVIRKIILYHLSPEALKMKKIKRRRLIDSSLEVETLNNATQKLRIGGWFRTVYINWARVIDSDLKATNGYAHAIGRVLLPPPDLVTGTFMVPTFFSTFSSAIQKVSLASSLKDSKSTTVFLPSNYAWARLGFRRLAFLFSPWGEEHLKKILLYHVSPQLVYTTNITRKHHDDKGGEDDFYDDGVSVRSGWHSPKRSHIELDSLEGSKIYIDAVLYGKRYLRVRINQRVRVTFTDAIGKNGVGHVIDNVLLPPSCELPTEEELAAKENTWPEFSVLNANPFGFILGEELAAYE